MAFYQRGVQFIEMFPSDHVEEAIDCYNSHRNRGFTTVTSLAVTLALIDGSSATPGLRRALARWVDANTRGTDIDGNNELVPRLDMMANETCPPDM